MKKSKKLRADEVVLKNFPELSKSKAQAMIMAGLVEFKNSRGLWEVLKKAGQPCSEDLELRVEDPSMKDVGRGAQKLRGAFDRWSELQEIAQNARALDIGASTGGFTQVLLERGAQKVFALDVGTNQLHERLRQDPRVISVEKQHVLKVEDSFWDSHDFRPPFDLMVTDLSFISLSRVIPYASPWLRNGAFWVLLVKPQFELSAEKLSKGIVKNDHFRHEAIEKILTLVQSLESLDIVEYIDCPLSGTDGNREFLLLLKKRV